MSTGRKSSRPQAGRERRRRFLQAGLAVAIVGEGGHQLFDRYGTAVGHHAFHVATIGAASVLFAGIVIADIRRNGRPRFSWRLRPDPPRLAANPRRRSRPSADRRLPKGPTLRVRRRSPLDRAGSRDSSTIRGRSRLSTPRERTSGR